MLLLVGPYYLIKMLLFTNDCHQFVKNTCKPDFEEIYHSQCTQAIPEVRLKAVKKRMELQCQALSQRNLVK